MDPQTQIWFEQSRQQVVQSGMDVAILWGLIFLLLGAGAYGLLYLLPQEPRVRQRSSREVGSEWVRQRRRR